jgi:hypothetical protein
VVQLQRETDLLEIVDALIAARGLPRGLNCRQQQSHQNSDDGDHYQQFHKRKTTQLSRAHEKPLFLCSCLV